MQVRELLKDKPATIICTTPSASIIDAMGLMIENKIRSLPVNDVSGKLTGIVSDSDIFRAVYQNLKDFRKLSVGDVMTSDVIVGLVDDDVEYIIAIMTENRIRHIPVLDGRELVGIVSQGDIVKSQMTDITVENRHLRVYINPDYPA